MTQQNDKEVFISLGGILSKVYRTEVSPEEYYAYTTEETEKIKVQQHAKRFGVGYTKRDYCCSAGIVTITVLIINKKHKHETPYYLIPNYCILYYM